MRKFKNSRNVVKGFIFIFSMLIISACAVSPDERTTKKNLTFQRDYNVQLRNECIESYRNKASHRGFSDPEIMIFCDCFGYRSTDNMEFTWGVKEKMLLRKVLLMSESKAELERIKMESSLQCKLNVEKLWNKKWSL